MNQQLIIVNKILCVFMRIDLQAMRPAGNDDRPAGNEYNIITASVSALEKRNYFLLYITNNGFFVDYL